MAQLGSKTKPVRLRVQTEERAMELYALCQAKGWQVIIGIEPDNDEDIEDIKKLEAGIKSTIILHASPSRNSPCPCGSGKQYKRCCGR